jgi:hypothetical protein
MLHSLDCLIMMAQERYQTLLTEVATERLIRRARDAINTATGIPGGSASGTPLTSRTGTRICALPDGQTHLNQRGTRL